MPGPGLWGCVPHGTCHGHLPGPPAAGLARPCPATGRGHVPLPQAAGYTREGSGQLPRTAVHSRVPRPVKQSAFSSHWCPAPISARACSLCACHGLSIPFLPHALCLSSNSPFKRMNPGRPPAPPGPLSAPSPLSHPARVRDSEGRQGELWTRAPTGPSHRERVSVTPAPQTGRREDDTERRPLVTAAMLGPV